MAATDQSVRVIGVRHHSPACARLVEHVIRSVRPKTVLIDRPADMNGRLDEIGLDHRLPVALFSYYQDERGSRASWAPFCDYSPEWIALKEGRAQGAEVRFMDLPAWAEAFHDTPNRYADHARSELGYVQRLCQRLGLDGMDALWDHLFEQPLALDDLEQRLAAYFAALRGEDERGAVGEDPNPRDAAREAYMAQCLAWAAARGSCVVVCGGYHKPLLERAFSALDPDWPEPPEPGDQARHGTYLVPYSFKRLDSFTGYASGMPSPNFYQAVWERGLERAGELLLEMCARELRRKKQMVSAADLIAWRTQTGGLMRLRGHEVPSRTDLLDGFASAVIKDALEQALPWIERGVIRAGTDPMIVCVLRALSGDRTGQLAPGTPRPPLLLEAHAELARLDLQPGRAARTVDLDLSEPRGRERSRVLHRLRLLSIPGFERLAGPSFALDPILTERWGLQEELRAESALIEASQWGASLGEATRALLESQLAQASGDVAALAELLGNAVMAGLSGLSRELSEALPDLCRRECDLGRLGVGLGQVLGLWRHGQGLCPGLVLPLGISVAAAFERGLWLFEGVVGASATAERSHLVAAVALRDTLRAAESELALGRGPAMDLLQRRAFDRAAPAALRGAALGWLWSEDGLPGAEGQDVSVRAVRGVHPVERLGDYLAGLFALAREAVQGAPALLAAIDELVLGMPEERFLVALPALRLAFSYFPPQERERVAASILRLKGKSPDRARELVRTKVSPERVAHGIDLERRTDARLTRYGLAPVPLSTGPGGALEGPA